MERSEDTGTSPTTPPVFVDDTGRRRARVRRVGRILVLGFVGYLALLTAGFARNPHIGSLALPTFGLPSLVHAPEPAPAILGETTTRAPSDVVAADGDKARNPGSSNENQAVEASRRGAPSGPTGGDEGAQSGAAPTGGGTDPAGGQLASVSTPAAPPTIQPAAATKTSTTPTTTTGPATTNGHGSKGSTTTTSPSTTTTSTAPSTTTPPGQGTSAASGKGPNGNGPPGQLRKSTTTTSPGPVG